MSDTGSEHELGMRAGERTLPGGLHVTGLYLMLGSDQQFGGASMARALPDAAGRGACHQDPRDAGRAACHQDPRDAAMEAG